MGIDAAPIANAARLLRTIAPSTDRHEIICVAHDMQNDMSSFAGGEIARDRVLAIDGCGATTIPYACDGTLSTSTPCVMYQGCMSGYPVVWCPTNAKGHSDQVPITTIGFWRFRSQL